VRRAATGQAGRHRLRAALAEAVGPARVVADPGHRLTDHAAVGHRQVRAGGEQAVGRAAGIAADPHVVAGRLHVDAQQRAGHVADAAARVRRRADRELAVAAREPGPREVRRRPHTGVRVAATDHVGDRRHEPRAVVAGRADAAPDVGLADLRPRPVQGTDQSRGRLEQRLRRAGHHAISDAGIELDVDAHGAAISEAGHTARTPHRLDLLDTAVRSDVGLRPHDLATVDEARRVVLPTRPGEATLREATAR
jgi:hypothetical protein